MTADAATSKQAEQAWQGVVSALKSAERGLDRMGKPAWIGVMILGFIFFWPIGLALLFYMIWSGRMGCRSRSWRHGRQRGMHSTGNTAFDEYREETLRRLEAEREEFMSFLQRLRAAKDRAEFDQFMAERAKKDAGGSGPGGSKDKGDPAPQPAG